MDDSVSNVFVEHITRIVTIYYSHIIMTFEKRYNGITRMLSDDYSMITTLDTLLCTIRFMINTNSGRISIARASRCVNWTPTLTKPGACGEKLGARSAPLRGQKELLLQPGVLQEPP